VSPNGVGYGILSASFVLSVMILPTIVSISLDALKSVPSVYYEGALALGASKEQAVFKVMLPAAKSGVLAAVVLAVGRVIGETMAVIMVLGNSPDMPTGLFQSVRTLTANIALGAMELMGKPFEALIATGIVLFVFTLLLNVSFLLLKRDKKKKVKNSEKKEPQAAAKAEQAVDFAVMSNTSAAKAEVKGYAPDTEYIPLKARHKRFSLCKVLKGLSVAMIAVTLAALAGVVLSILVTGIPNLSWHFVFGKYELDNPTLGPALVGTATLIGLSLLVAVPVGIGTAVFLTEYSKTESKLVKFIRVAVETLAGIPSIVYGLFGYLFFVKALGLGRTLLGGGLTLAIMILPVIVRSTEESLLAVPRELREASFGLGASKTRTIFRVMIPGASSGIVTSIVLAAGRVISESAVLILTIGLAVDTMPTGLLSSGTSLALNIYYFGGYLKDGSGAAEATGVVLLIVVILISILAGVLGKRLNKRNGKA
jgi:phosphate transport system permease protein